MITDKQIEHLRARAGTLMKELSSWPPMEPKAAFRAAVQCSKIRSACLDAPDMMAMNCIMLMMAVIGEWPPVSPAQFAAAEAHGFQSSQCSEMFATSARMLVQWIPEATPRKEDMN